MLNASRIKITQYVPYEDIPRVTVAYYDQLVATPVESTMSPSYTRITIDFANLPGSWFNVPYGGSLEIEAV